MKKFLIIFSVFFLLANGAAKAEDIAPPSQGPGEHTTIATADGKHIRDDKLAEYVASKIPKDGGGNPQVKDVKIFVQSCYGGGLLDDFAKVFGPGGACEGVPWVGGSASSDNECSHRLSDERAGDKGSGFWTDSLTPEVSDGGNVATDLTTAKANNLCAPGGVIDKQIGKKENSTVPAEMAETVSPGQVLPNTMR